MTLTEEVLSRITGLAILPTITGPLSGLSPSSTHFSHICITNLYTFFKSLLNCYFINKVYVDQPTNSNPLYISDPHYHMLFMLVCRTHQLLTINVLHLLFTFGLLQ